MQAEKAAFEEAEKKREEEVIFNFFLVLYLFICTSYLSFFFCYQGIPQ